LVHRTDTWGREDNASKAPRKGRFFVNIHIHSSLSTAVGP
jgi:hypothetical protein